MCRAKLGVNCEAATERAGGTGASYGARSSKSRSVSRRLTTETVGRGTVSVIVSSADGPIGCGTLPARVAIPRGRRTLVFDLMPASAESTRDVSADVRTTHRGRVMHAVRTPRLERLEASRPI